MDDLTLPPKEDPYHPGMCDLCNGPLGADDCKPRSLGLCEAAGCHDRCRGCGHEVWEHDPDGCLSSDHYRTPDGDEDSDFCECVLHITDVPYGMHSQEHYDYTGTRWGDALAARAAAGLGG